MDAVVNEEILKKFNIVLADKLNALGYRRKSTLVKRLNRQYRQNIDFIIIPINPQSQREIYLLTEDCYADLKRRKSLDCQKEKEIQKELIETENLSVDKENYLIDDTMGRIGILTDKELIEVKRAKEWKEALGQLLVYHTYFEDKQPRLHLFIHSKDKESQILLKNEEKAKVENTCEKLKIQVTWHESELAKLHLQPLMAAKCKILKSLEIVAFVWEEIKKMSRFLDRKKKTC